jgi:hypothetical protein
MSRKHAVAHRASSALSAALENLERRLLFVDVGDSFATSTSTGIAPNSGTYSLTESLGNGLTGASDVDLFKFQAFAGSVVTATTSQSDGSPIADTYLRLFNGTGSQVAANHLASSGTGSQISVTVDGTGTYYIGVSGFANTNYNAAIAGSGIAGATGTYVVTINIADTDIGDTMTSAMVTNLGVGAPFTMIEPTGNNPTFGTRDADLYRFDAAEGSTLTANTSFPPDGQADDTIIRLFDSTGHQIALNDDDPAGGTLYSRLTYTLNQPGINTYYLGVSGYNNRTYNTSIEGSGVNGSVGDYQLTMSITRPAPLVRTCQFIFDPPPSMPQSLSIQFSQDVSGSLGPEDVTLTNVSTNEVVPSNVLSMNYQADGVNVLTITTPTLPFGALPDGDYELKLTASGIMNSSGVPMVSDLTYSFFFIMGDANHDRAVDLTDFTILATNFNATGATFSQGNFNYDDQVDLTDFTLLASQFNKSLGDPPASVAAPSRAMLIANQLNVFADSPIDDLLNFAGLSA